MLGLESGRPRVHPLFGLLLQRVLSLSDSTASILPLQGLLPVFGLETGAAWLTLCPPNGRLLAASAARTVRRISRGASRGCTDLTESIMRSPQKTLTLEHVGVDTIQAPPGHRLYLTCLARTSIFCHSAPSIVPASTMLFDELPIDIMNELAKVTPTADLKTIRLLLRYTNAAVAHEFYQRVPRTWSVTLAEGSIKTLKEVAMVHGAAKRITSLTMVPADVGVIYDL